uniref:Nudix hydrolase domain-containing protein n=1 Tax=viral metagenome TaxID=1070528 RepID=A0A6C0E8R5_9ZZZZ
MTMYIFNENFTSLWYCGGVILFNSDRTKVLIVETHSSSVGFTKGKREPGETLLDTAHREVKEESGYDPDDYLHDMTVIGEKKSAKIHSIYFFIGTLKTKELENKPLVFDKNELKRVCWITIDQALQKLSPRKLDILNAALNYFSNNINNNT